MRAHFGPAKKARFWPGLGPWRGGGGGAEQSKTGFVWLPSLAQAHAVWQWWNCAASHVPPGFTLLRLSLDETSVGLCKAAAKAQSRSPRSGMDRCSEQVGG